MRSGADRLAAHGVVRFFEESDWSLVVKSDEGFVFSCVGAKIQTIGVRTIIFKSFLFLYVF
jgi:hypothetical protein